MGKTDYIRQRWQRLQLGENVGWGTPEVVFIKVGFVNQPGANAKLNLAHPQGSASHERTIFYWCRMNTLKSFSESLRGAFHGCLGQVDSGERGHRQKANTFSENLRLWSENLRHWQASRAPLQDRGFEFYLCAGAGLLDPLQTILSPNANYTRAGLPDKNWRSGCTERHRTIIA